MMSHELLKDTRILAKRNLKIFFRDRTSVIAALMGVIMVLVLYLAILRPNIVAEYAAYDSASLMADTWVIGGLLCIIPVTSAAVALGPMVKDRYTGAIRDFRASPAGPWAITGGYLVSTFIISLVMTSIFLIIATVWIFVSGEAIGIKEFAFAIGLMFPTSLFSCAMMYFLTTFTKSRASYDGLVMLTNLLMGFFTGTYVPLGLFPKGLQTALSLFPATQAGSIYRDILGSGAIETTFISGSELIDAREILGFDLFVGGVQITPLIAIISLIGSTALLFVLSVLIAKRK